PQKISLRSIFGFKMRAVYNTPENIYHTDCMNAENATVDCIDVGINAIVNARYDMYV
ncbi:10232_t:CDS:1, partial [Racocetra fulgida]